MDALEMKLMAEIYTPIRASMYRAANQTGLVTATDTQIQYDTIEYDYAGIVTGLNTVNAAFKIPCSGWYLISGAASLQVPAGNGQAFFSPNRNVTNNFTGVTIGTQLPLTNAGGTLPCMTGSEIWPLTIGDLIGGMAFQSAGANGTITGGLTATYLRIVLLQEGLA